MEMGMRWEGREAVKDRRTQETATVPNPEVWSLQLTEEEEGGGEVGRVSRSSLGWATDGAENTALVLSVSENPNTRTAGAHPVQGCGWKTLAG